MKKMLLTLTAVGVLAVPVGTVLAQGKQSDQGGNGGPGPVPTCVEPVRERDRDRDRDRIVTQDRVTQDSVVSEDREQTRLRLHRHDGTCDQDCTGDRTPDRDRDRIHVD